ncbi:MAG: hypothetical protein QF745_10255 [Planctomycetota bacterium]|jgi:hypothetical protein|nr:hypothetical protein [Planctomycetota bacterium]MDP7560907.1 hypothetical protein [Planctomycetota bacterium]
MPTSKRRKKEEGILTIANPLGVLFGRTLQRFRGRTLDGPFNSEEMAHALGLKYPSYRLVETGASPLRPSRSLLIARKLQLEWSRVAQVLVAIQLLEEVNDSVESMRRRAAEVARQDIELAPLVSYPDSVWSAIQNGTPLSALAENPAIVSLMDPMEQFLSQAANLGFLQESSQPSTIWGRAIEGTPPYYLEFLHNQIISYKGMLPPRVNADHLAEFESQNRHRFRRIYGLLRDPEMLRVVTEEQGTTFDWPYLLFPTLEILAILVNPGKRHSSQKLLSIFKKGISDIWRAERPDLGEKDIESALGKVHVKVLDPGDPISDFFEYDMTAEKQAQLGSESKSFVMLNNLWMYELGGPRNTVIFVDNFSEKIQDPLFASSCSWDFTNALATRIEEKWLPELRQAELPPHYATLESG